MRLKLLVFFSFLGFGISTFLSRYYYQIRGIEESFQPCNAWIASPWASLWGNIPVSSLSAALFVGIFFSAAFAHLRAARADSVRGLVIFSGAQLLVSSFQILNLVLITRTFCFWGWFVAGISLACAVLTWPLRSESREGKLKLAGIITATGIIVIPALGNFEFKPVDQKFSDADYVSGLLATEPNPTLPAGSQYPSIGPSNAPVEILIFADLQCKVSRKAAFTLSALQNRIPGAVRILFKHFPKDGACNVLVPPGGGNTAACEAAYALHCAAEQGQFQKAYEILWNRQSEITSGRTSSLLSELPLNIDQLQSCMSNEKTRAAVLNDIQEGIRNKVNYTPEIYFNQRRAIGLYPLSVWEKSVRQLSDTRRVNAN